MLPAHRPPTSPLCLALLALLLVPLAAGCSISPWKREVIFSANGVALYRERQEKEGQIVPLGYKHPLQVSIEKLAVILSRAEYEERSLFRRARTTHVFKPEQVQAAAEAMSIGLGQLSPDARLRFLVTNKDWMATIRGVIGTSGVLFSREEGVLDLAFDNIQEGIAGGDEGDPKKVTFHYEPTEIRDESPVLPMPGSRSHVEAATGETYPRWLEIELARVERLPIPPAPASPGAAAPASAPPAPASGSAAGVAAPTASAVEEERYRRTRARVELLRRLRADGALSEDEYKRELDKALSETK